MDFNQEEYIKQVKKNLEKLKEELPKLKENLDTKMIQHGSVELMANIAIQEIFVQNPLMHNPDNPLAENPYLAFLLGLFLVKNKLDAGEPTPEIVSDVLESTNNYFDKFKWAVSPIDPENVKEEDFLIFVTRQKKFLDDLNPHCYPKQKEDYVKRVFSKVDYFLESKYGFNSNDAILFSKKIIDKIERSIWEKYKQTSELTKKFKEQSYAKKEEVETALQEKNMTMEQMINHFGNTHLLYNSKDILTINVKNFCQEENISDEEKFKKYLNAISCKFGEQVNRFEDPLSDNIIFYKPIIQLDENNYFCPKPDFLIYKLDSVLENLLGEDSNALDKFNESKSVYLEDKSYEFFSRIFPKENLYRNLRFDFNGQNFETDLLLLYDDKIFVIESKSSHLPLSAKRGGIVSLENGLKAIVKKAYTQGSNVRDYINSQQTVKFQDEQKNTVLELTLIPENEFFFINVTTENLGLIGTNLKRLDILDLFTDDEYPWSVNIYDLDTVSDCISEPAYFIHYLEQRIRAQKQDIFEAVEEIDFLGYYYKNGNFYTELVASGHTTSIMISPDFYQILDNCYLLDKPKPQMNIPKILDELIKNMQKYRQKGFTKVTSLLLDLPYAQRKLLSSKIKQKLVKIGKDKCPDGFYLALPDPYDIGFSYFTSTTTTDFHKHAKKRMLLCKYDNKIKRWAMIGRNINDKKNFTTVYYYDDSDWAYDEELENDIPLIPINYFNV